jgi:hypothetical protein
MTESEDYIRGLQWAGRLAMHLPDCPAVPADQRDAGFVWACIVMVKAVAEEVERLKTGKQTDDKSGHHLKP